MSIKTDAQVIRDETTAGANTATRVGSNLVAIADDLLAKQTAIDLNTAKVSYTDAAQVSTNTSDITTLQGEQTTQDAAIALNTAKRSYPSADETKLAGISAGAEVNPDVVPQAEAEAGTATTERIWTAQRVKQAIDALGGGGGASVDDTAYAISWDGVTSVAPSKNAIYDLIENQVFKVDSTSNIIPIFWGGTQAEYDIDFPAGHPSNYFVIITDGAVTPLDATDITNTPSGNLVATNVQDALNELQTEIDGLGGSYTDEQAQDAIGTILVDSSEIDFTYNDATPSITASIVAGSIDETKLDTSVNASLDLADTAVQPAAIADFETTTELNARDTANRARANHTGTQLAATISDFQATVSANTDVVDNTAKVTNATHTGDVTGATALTIDPTAISGKSANAGLTGAEEVLINNAGTLEKTTTQDIADLGGGGGVLQEASVIVTNPTISGGISVTELLAAQGAGKIIIITSISIVCVGGVAPTTSVSGHVRYNGDAAELGSGTLLVSNGVSNFNLGFTMTNFFNATTHVNVGIDAYLVSATDEAITGDFHFHITYKVFDTTTGF